ncbi:hypothetical protein FIV32_09520 [Sphingomonadales bacterium 58]|uniref:hypothetical protein n=1 Tax=Sphingobium sp. S8 TaxID=2758385 RepID=UPI001918FD3C|nr:hypothetical protein [Sphingobium sp. S8]MBY2958978.1 hypothetical protein [Sphingomonadales bacterium 58]CAD7338170.1 hypothetical protein SPHS8_01925 [Sphingobium sp. S8]
MTARRDSLWETFPPETLHALFEAVEVDDVVDPEVSLPEPIDLHCPRDDMARCFALCLHFWSEGVRRDDLLRLLGILLREGDLAPAERLQYKHIRAKYKHLRFALVLYDGHHRIPRLFSFTVAIMGHLQDAFRNGRRAAVIGHVLLLRLLLTRPLWVLVERRARALRLDSADGFLAYRKAEIRRLKKALEQENLTGHEFHMMRKVISRHVSFYDTLRSLRPSEHDVRMSRYLSAINGLMGSRHDEMIEQAASGQRAYGTAAPLDADIRRRLEWLVARYPLEERSR